MKSVNGKACASNRVFGDDNERVLLIIMTYKLVL